MDGIVTQGRKDAAQWLTLYDIYTSNDQTNWNRVSSGENSQVTCGGPQRGVDRGSLAVA